MNQKLITRERNVFSGDSWKYFFQLCKSFSCYYNHEYKWSHRSIKRIRKNILLSVILLVYFKSIAWILSNSSSDWYGGKKNSFLFVVMCENRVDTKNMNYWFKFTYSKINFESAFLPCFNVFKAPNFCRQSHQTKKLPPRSACLLTY